MKIFILEGMDDHYFHVIVIIWQVLKRGDRVLSLSGIFSSSKINIINQTLVFLKWTQFRNETNSLTVK